MPLRILGVIVLSFGYWVFIMVSDGLLRGLAEWLLQVLRFGVSGLR